MTNKRRFDEERAALDPLAKGVEPTSKQGIEALAALLYRAIPMPLALGREIEVRFDPTEGVLLYTLSLPDLEKVPFAVELATKIRPASEKEVRAAQELLVHSIPLRLIHEVFTTPGLKSVNFVGVNVRLSFINRSNGRQMNQIVGSLAATREEFGNINIAEVDPKLCFRSLKGVASPSFQDLSAVRPVLVFDTDDKRIVKGREVVDKLDSKTNLAAMNWEDFEHIVRELFSKMFSARNALAEVHVTRASRDYGVDAIVHDPDPIHGGKFVIQAKRYVNTVEVSAVRDLFGTVQNEGANRGFLVTTSSFGPDAFAFAKGKPITLIDGPHLLQLLQTHGYSFRIDLKEAKNLLHSR
ncbi:restriction endonuclease [Mesorhizobium sp. KR9-304]|uniref:restriction endonuclease n=1 Tax=Mesorhizobium sp. KR9-304 TaxID=3156614 RepID=UPI0032B4589D